MYLTVSVIIYCIELKINHFESVILFSAKIQLFVTCKNKIFTSSECTYYIKLMRLFFVIIYKQKDCFYYFLAVTAMVKYF